MMVSSFALWWFAMVAVDSILVGLLLFEIVHDVQYNALVWVYNERRVEQHRTASRIEKFLFQPGMTRVLLYVAMILFYGSIADILGYANVQAPNALQLSVNAVSFWTGLFMVSTFLHFYFDGFIWQVREKEFRESIGIGNGGVVPNRPSPNRRFAEGLQVSWKWAFFLIPVSILGVTEYKETPIPLLAQAQNALELLPNRWQANAIVGSLEKATGDEVHAIEHLLRAVALNPSYSFGETMLADLYERRGDDDLALEHSKRAAELNPDNYELQNSLGKALVNRGQLKAAIPHLQIAAQHIGNDANLNYILGAALIQQKRPVEGIPYLERAVYLDPREKKAWNYLGIALQDQGDLKEAEHYYRKALDVDPGYMPALQNLEQTQRLLGE
jgi:Flp pilus assembly protein TadD